MNQPSIVSTRQPSAILISATLVAALLTGCSREYTRESFAFEQVISRLEVDVDSNVMVDPSGTSSSFVDVDASCVGGASRYDVSVSGDVLTVSYGCSFDSDGLFRVRIPASVAVANIRSDAGNIDASDLEGQLNLTADAGNLHVSNLRGNVGLRGDAGNITGNEACDTCVVYADAGNITLDFLLPPSRLDLGADAGNIDVRVPAGAYNISTKVDSGTQRISALVNDPAAPRYIKAEVDSGNITLTGY
jgi:hypothetical protein